MTAPTRRRDASRSRDLLLEAGRSLFAERGFDRTTTRDIGERAGVDPALIARYYGSKTALYIAVLHADSADSALPDLLDPERMAGLLARLSRGPGPIFQAAVRAHPDPDVQTTVRAELHARLVDPLRDRFSAAGLDRPQLRAEVAVAAFAGVGLGRTSGGFDALSTAPLDEVLALTAALLSALETG
jgi:AcrR family transcriptional regulator